MKITRYAHACMVLEDQGQKIIIDPGIYTPEFGVTDGFVAIFISHFHTDHFYPQNIKKITQANPSVIIYTTPDVAEILDHDNVVPVTDGDEHNIGPFTLHFTGDFHAEAHPDWQRNISNLGLRVNQDFYYGGDSFIPPDTPVTVLAAPISYAWAPMHMVMDYIADVAPKICIPIHDAPLSEKGIATGHKWVARMCKKQNIQFTPLPPKASLKLP